MKLLLDTNISWRLVKLLQEKDIDCIHVEQTSLPVPATDRSIWEYALSENYIIVTNDEDFLNMSNLYGFPPKVLLIKTGNMRTTGLYDLILKHYSAISEFANNADIGLLEIYNKQ
mgnify:FL=1